MPERNERKSGARARRGLPRREGAQPAQRESQAEKQGTSAAKGGEPGARGDGRLLETRMDRRGFFKATGALAAAAGLISACDAPSPRQTGTLSTPQPITPEVVRFPDIEGPNENVPLTPSEPPDPEVLTFFSLHEARTVEALTAVILPGTPEDPGAREAGVVNYIDHVLSHSHGFAQPIYHHPPFAEPYFGEEPPEAEPGEPYRPIWVQAQLLPRYGYQSSLTPREIYRRGIELVDRYSRERFGAVFVELPEPQQEAVVEAMAEGLGPFGLEGAAQGQREARAAAATPQGAQGARPGAEVGLAPPALNEFFEVLRSHTIEGVFADPLYGGNRDLVGWRMINYPGAQRAYTPVEMGIEGIDRLPQSIAQLPHFNAGQPANENVILPVSGTDRRHMDEEESWR